MLSRVPFVPLFFCFSCYVCAVYVCACSKTMFARACLTRSSQWGHDHDGGDGTATRPRRPRHFVFTHPVDPHPVQLVLYTGMRTPVTLRAVNSKYEHYCCANKCNFEPTTVPIMFALSRNVCAPLNENRSLLSILWRARQPLSFPCDVNTISSYTHKQKKSVTYVPDPHLAFTSRRGSRQAVRDRC